jgi:YVTN family beta-propeller protein
VQQRTSHATEKKRSALAAADYRVGPSPTATIPVGGFPFDVEVNPAGTRAYVTHNGNTVSVIDTSTSTVTAISVGSGPRKLAFTPSGSRLYVTHRFGELVASVVEGG